jgi:hypothetical protein
MRAALGYALMLAILSSPACHTMKVVGIDQAPASDRVSLTLSDRSVVVVYGPKIYGDKLVGFVDGKYHEFPTAQVKEIRAREPAPGRTTALIAASVVVVGGFVAWGLSSLGTKGGFTPDICDVEPENELCG